MHQILRQPPSVGYNPKKSTNPYLFFTLDSLTSFQNRSSSGKKSKSDPHSMDFKTDATSDCEQWVQALRDLLKTSAGNQRRVKMAAKEAMKMNHQSSSLPTAFDVTGCGDTNVNGIYRNLHRTKNGARLYMSEAGYVLSREIIDRKAGWIIGKNQVSVWVFCSNNAVVEWLESSEFVFACFFVVFRWHCMAQPNQKVQPAQPAQPAQPVQQAQQRPRQRLQPVPQSKQQKPCCFHHRPRAGKYLMEWHHHPQSVKRLFPPEKQM